jgi:putative PIN family toxin of toxin-antitoxin system
MGATPVVIDTNVLISAFGWQGKPFLILELLLEKKFQLIVSEKQLEELIRVSAYAHINYPPEKQQRFIDLIVYLANIVKTHEQLDIIKEDPSDNAILEAAIEHNAAFIITGDKHLLKLKQFRNVQIVTPAEFLQR